MPSTWLRRFLVPLSLLALVAAACGGDDEGGGGGGGGGGGATGPECNADIRVGLALDVGGLGDKSFNDAADAGLQRAIDDGLVCEENVEVVEANATGSNRGENVQGLAEAGFDIVLANGFLFSEDVSQLAPDYPETNFAITDGFATALAEAPNVADLTFKEHEGSFLVGAAAALVCGCDTVGFLGGVPGELIGRFEAGFTAGVKYIDPNIEVLVEYISEDPAVGFVDAVRGEALSTKMYDGGAEIIYHAAGLAGGGLFTAAVKADKLAIGVDSDQYLTASAAQKPLIVTSMLKRVDTALYNAIEQTGSGTFQSGFQSFGLAEEGVDYSRSNTEALTDDITAQLDAIKQMILDGEIVVPDKPEDA
jgi:basic membrane protein A